MTTTAVTPATVTTAVAPLVDARSKYKISDRLQMAINRVVNNVNVVTTLPFVIKSRRTTATASTTVPADVKVLLSCQICPDLWVLNADAYQCAGCVESVAYDIAQRQLRVRLVDRDGDAGVSDNVWRYEEPSPIEIHTALRNIDVDISDIEIIDDPQVRDLVELIVRIVVAGATRCGATTSASVHQFTDEHRRRAGISATANAPEYVVTVRGIAIVGPRIMSPTSWCDVLPRSVCASIETLVRLETGEHRTAITMHTITALKKYYNTASDGTLLSVLACTDGGMPDPGTWGSSKKSKKL
jgi:hypothetical protein